MLWRGVRVVVSRAGMFVRGVCHHFWDGTRRIGESVAFNVKR